MAAVALAVVLLALVSPLLAAAGYLLLFVLLSSKPRPPLGDAQSVRFRVIVPAHNEELGIAETVRNLQKLDYPAPAFSVLVVADNCTDATAQNARAAGAEVLERQDAERRGKGYALLHAFERLEPSVDAVVVVDADTLVSPNLLSAFAARLASGAHAVQADYAVRNSADSWRTRLMAVAFGAFHIVRGRGRERLRLSAGLRGNGMCFSRDVLGRVPHDAFSIVEDVEYGIRLGEAGERVYYADEAHVYGEMVSSAKAARSQRERWEGGRRALVKAHASRLLRRGLREHNRVLFDLGLDLRIPPLAQLVLATFFGCCVALGAALWLGGPLWVLSGLLCACLGVLVLYVLRGWSVSGTGVRGLLDLLLSPVYMAWKLLGVRRASGKTDAAWIRTTREAEGDQAQGGP